MRIKTLPFLAFLTFLPNADAILNGQPANDDEYMAVGALKAEGRASCTATLITPEWVVTAQHCRWGGSEENPIEYEPKDVEFLLGADASSPKLAVRLSDWINPPDEESDVAFVKLSKPVTQIGDRVVSPIPLVVIDWKTAKPGQDHFEVVGFGVRSETQELKPASGVREKADLLLTATEGNALMNLFSSLEKFEDYLKKAHPGEEEMISAHVHKADLILGREVHAWDPRGREGGVFASVPPGGWADTCFSDSGGPLLALKDGKRVVVGVISSGFNGATLGCVPLGTKISVFDSKMAKSFQSEKAHAVSPSPTE